MTVTELDRAGNCYIPVFLVVSLILVLTFYHYKINQSNNRGVINFYSTTYRKMEISAVQLKV